jgi:hypothetical protein
MSHRRTTLTDCGAWSPQEEVRMVGKLGLGSALQALAAATVAALIFALGAGASPSPTVSFSASSDGASAHWSQGKGSPIDLTLGSNSATTYAVITLHHVARVAVGDLVEPTFQTDNYNAGSPRYYITLSDGHSLWGYPPNAGLNGTDFAWAIDNGNTYMSWSAVQEAEGSAAVTGAWVIADGDQAAGTTDVISGLQFDGTSFN